MSQELIYTSAPRGLHPGSQGFCTVAASKSLSAPWREALERLSSYRPPFPPGDPRNPVRYSHLRLTVAGQTRSVLSRVADAGLDYSGRSNILAHHVVVAPDEQCPAGPAWLMQQPDTFPEWNGEVGWRADRRLPHGDDPPRKCVAWEAATGDAGWGGALVEAACDRRAVDFFSNGGQALTLIGESLTLMDPADRWSTNWATLPSDGAVGASFDWQGHLASSANADLLRRRARSVVIDLTARMGPAVNRYADSARSGNDSGRPDGNEVPFFAPEEPTESHGAVGGSSRHSEMRSGQLSERRRRTPPLPSRTDATSRRQFAAIAAGALTMALLFAFLVTALLLMRHAPDEVPKTKVAEKAPDGVNRLQPPNDLPKAETGQQSDSKQQANGNLVSSPESKGGHSQEPTASPPTDEASKTANKQSLPVVVNPGPPAKTEASSPLT